MQVKLQQLFKENIKKFNIFIYLRYLFYPLAGFLVLRFCSYHFLLFEKLILFGLSVWAIVRLKNNLKQIEVFKSLKHALLFSGFALCFAFCIFGNAVLLKNVQYSVTIKDIIKFLYIAVWLSPIALLLLSLCDKAMIHMHRQSNDFTFTRRDKRLVFSLCFGIIFTVCTLYLFAFNPAISSYDSFDQFRQAIGESELTNWHSPLHTLFIRLVVMICSAFNALAFSPSVAAILQFAYFAAIWSCGMVFLYENQLKITTAILVTFVFALMPNNSLMLVTLWKDIPYTTTLLWITILIAKLIVKPDRYRKDVVFYIQLTVSLILVMLLRQNGIVPYVACSLGLLLLLKFNYRIIASILSALIVVVLFMNPVLKLLNFKDEAVQNGKYLGLAQDINIVYESDGQLSPKAEEYILSVKGDMQFRNNVIGYFPYYSDLVISGDVDINIPEFISMYVDTAFRNPAKTLKALLFRTDYIYNVLVPTNAYLGTSLYSLTAEDIEMDGDRWENHFNIRKENGLTVLLSNLINEMRANPICTYLFQRAGMYTVLALAMLWVVIYRKKKKGLLIFTVWFSQIISLVLSCGWQDYRYVWSLVVITLFIIVFFLSDAFAENRKLPEES